MTMFASAVLAATLASAHPAQPTASVAPAGSAVAADEIVLRDWLVIEPVGRYERAPIHVDAVEQAIVAGQWQPPRAGDVVTLPDGSQRIWRQVTLAGKDDALADPALSGGYACALVECPAARTLLLEATGQAALYVNGIPRVTDPYGTGWVRLPVMLQPGANTFLFRLGRGENRAKLVPAAVPVQLDARDLTLPDLIIGEPVDTWGAIVVINATSSAVAAGLLEVQYDGGEVARTPLPMIPPLTMRKVGFRLHGPVPAKAGETTAVLRVLRSSGSREEKLDQAEFSLAVRTADERHKRTFISGIDGSVQYYAVMPVRSDARDGNERPALFLTLHGAAVEATNQAAAYAPKTWGHLVAPTNRRPYGFDWEDIGRLDALEVLQLAAERLHTDPQRTYLLGHSMGGHGVWQLGALYPDRFAAIAPSAGWISFTSYTGAAHYAATDGVEGILRRAAAPSDTLVLSRNYAHYGVYVLHGDQDDNVPVEEARTMRSNLGSFHADFAYYERPGAGHWWGNECMDWPPLFDFLRCHARPAPHSVREVEFVTACPGVSAAAHWVTVAAQQHALLPSRVKLSLDPAQRRFSGTTENVARLALDLRALSSVVPGTSGAASQPAPLLPAGDSLSVALDGQTLADIPWPAGEPRVWLSRSDDTWGLSAEPSPDLKGPHRAGPFKAVFQNRFQLVYGTRGTPDENAWARAKACFDAEVFWYRGNGSVDVVADTDFDAHAEPDRNVVLYGNAETNSAWPALLAACPVGLRAGQVIIGGRRLAADDLACLFVYPRAGSSRALVAGVGGTGLAGMRLTDRLAYFVSGAGYPDCLVLAPDVLTAGIRGIRVAGFFGPDWAISSGDFAWSEPPLGPR